MTAAVVPVVPMATGEPVAACATPGADPEWWFSSDPQEHRQALALCGMCRVREACAHLAADIGAVHGLWGDGVLRGEHVSTPPPAAAAGSAQTRRSPAGAAHLSPAAESVLAAVRADPLLPDVVDGYHHAAAAADAPRLWRAVAAHAPQDSLLGRVHHVRRDLLDGQVLQVGMPVGEAMDDVALVVSHRLPLQQLPGRSGPEGAQDAVGLLERSVQAIAGAAETMVDRWPPGLARREPDAERLLAMVAADPRTARLAAGFGRGPQDTVARTAAIWDRLAAEQAPGRSVLSRCRFTIDGRRKEVLVEVPVRSGGVGVWLQRSIGMHELVPGDGGDPLRRGAEVLAQTLGLLSGAGRADKVWAARDRAASPADAVYLAWRSAIEAAEPGSSLEGLTCRSHGGRIVLSTPLSDLRTALMQQVDPTDPAISADPLAALHRAAKDLSAARTAAGRVLPPPVPAHLLPTEDETAHDQREATVRGVGVSR
jgi:hypothetical protein